MRILVGKTDILEITLCKSLGSTTQKRIRSVLSMYFCFRSLYIIVDNFGSIQLLAKIVKLGALCKYTGVSAVV